MIHDISIITGTFNPETKYKVAGLVKIDGVPSPARCVLIDRRDLSYVGSSMAGSDGVFEISGIWDPGERNGQFFAYDDSGNFNAKTVDFITVVAR